MKKYVISVIFVITFVLSVSVLEAGIKDFKKSMAEGESWTGIVNLMGGKNYKFSASGCPKVESIGIYIIDNNGGVVMQDSGTSTPSLCYKPSRSGAYKIKVVLESTVMGSNSGVVKANLEEGCDSPIYYYYGPCR